MKGKEMNINEWNMKKQTHRKCIGMEWTWLAIQAPSFFTFPSWVLSCIVPFLFFLNWYWLHSKSIVVHISATWCHHVVILHRAGSQSELQHLSLPTLWKSCATMAEASVASGRCLALTMQDGDHLRSIGTTVIFGICATQPSHSIPGSFQCDDLVFGVFLTARPLSSQCRWQPWRFEESMMLQTLEVPMFCTPLKRLKGIGNILPHGWGPQGRVSAITSKRLESSERGTKGRPPEAVPGKFGPRDTGTCRNIATSPWISPSWIWNWWHLFRASSLLLRQIQTWARARVQLYTLAAQDLRIFSRLPIKAAVGELSVLGCRAPQPREGNLATCQGLEHVNNFKTLIDLYVCWISSGYLQLLSVPIFRYWTALLKTYFHSILLLYAYMGRV